MFRDVLYAYCALLVSVLLGITSQMLFKSGVVKATGIISTLFQPWTILGMVGYFISLLCYLFALRQISISTAYPMLSITYVVVPLLGYFIWHEPFNALKVVALIMITSGVALLCASNV